MNLLLLVLLVVACVCVPVSLSLSVDEDPITYGVRFLAPKKLQYADSNDISCSLLYFGETQQHRMVGEERQYVIELRPQAHEVDHDEEHEESEDETYIYEIFSHDQVLLKKILNDMCSSTTEDVEEATLLPLADEVRPIVKSGAPSNRIDLVMMGDGYTASENAKFFDDITRLVKEMFQDITFASYLPVFNIWALYRESIQSGIGVGGVARNTAFGLYRDGTELRGIYCSKTTAARSACTATGTCDFPTLIGNDAYYGGLGGEFTISTSSPTTGTVVLRHEMGHNFASVGEEYDGGSAYSGANSAATVAGLQWKSWLSEPSNLVAQQSAQRIQSYAWYDLAKGPFTLTFTTDGSWARSYLIFSASGCEVAGAISVTLDGVALAWKPQIVGNLDRSFYPFLLDTPLASGTHRLVFTQLIAPTSGRIRQLCNVNMHEYKASPAFHFENTYVGAYNTWNSAGRVTFRPTNELCLMRNMTSPVFCPICQEAIWIQFFKRISVIDNVTLSTSGTDVSVGLDLLGVGPKRPVPIAGESVAISWFKNNVEDTNLRNQTQWTRPIASNTGSWSVTARFITPEVRSDPNNVLTGKKTFTI